MFYDIRDGCINTDRLSLIGEVLILIIGKSNLIPRTSIKNGTKRGTLYTNRLYINFLGDYFFVRFFVKFLETGSLMLFTVIS